MFQIKYLVFNFILLIFSIAYRFFLEKFTEKKNRYYENA